MLTTKSTVALVVSLVTLAFIGNGFYFRAVTDEVRDVKLERRQLSSEITALAVRTEGLAVEVKALEDRLSDIKAFALEGRDAALETRAMLKALGTAPVTKDGGR